MRSELGRLLVLLGLVITVLGLVLWSGLGRPWLGRLPGDIHYSKGNFSFYFPVVTCLLLSLIITLVMWWFRR
jgi:uncharacterized protein YybS (DUF2232 family)